VAISESELLPSAFEQIAWVLPKELGQYDFLAANSQLVANLATGRIKPGEILQAAVRAPHPTTPDQSSGSGQ
jgi:hypothetical protein